MKQNSSFQEILEEKLGAGRPTPETDWTLSPGEPAHLAYLLGQIGVFRFPKPRPSPPPSSPSREKPRPAVPAPRAKGPPHALSERQKTAMGWFQDQGEALADDFNEKELKTAFRRLARRLHPDVHPQGNDLFLTLKTQHRCLEEIFKRPV
ncbi:MAG: hypothetical protein KF802_03840 [Bdellovibrionaceae bacterium]|nr:hypothetical protein [Pseudobdellovibrionaceae bacterium]